MNRKAGTGMFRQAIPPRNPNDVRNAQVMQGRLQPQMQTSQQAQLVAFQRVQAQKRAYMMAHAARQAHMAKNVSNPPTKEEDWLKNPVSEVPNNKPRNNKQKNTRKKSESTEETKRELDRLLEVVNEKETRLNQLYELEERTQEEAELKMIKKRDEADNLKREKYINNKINEYKLIEQQIRDEIDELHKKTVLKEKEKSEYIQAREDSLNIAKKHGDAAEQAQLELERLQMAITDKKEEEETKTEAHRVSLEKAKEEARMHKIAQQKKYAANELENLRQKMAIRKAEAEAREQARRIEEENAQKQAEVEFEELQQRISEMEQQLM